MIGVKKLKLETKSEYENIQKQINVDGEPKKI